MIVLYYKRTLILQKTGMFHTMEMSALLYLLPCAPYFADYKSSKPYLC